MKKFKSISKASLSVKALMLFYPKTALFNFELGQCGVYVVTIFRDTIFWHKKLVSFVLDSGVKVD